ncbi:hypothetical protein ACX40Y_16965 [Sphingomonas sp. RS6]
MLCAGALPEASVRIAPRTPRFHPFMLVFPEWHGYRPAAAMVYDGNIFSSNRKNMMRNSYGLPPRKAGLCRAIGAVFLLAAAITTIVIAVAGISPGASPICGGDEPCAWRAQPIQLLDQDVQFAVLATTDARRNFEAYVARADVRLGLAAVEAINLGPFAFLLLGVGLALRRLGANEPDALPRALRWLRLSAIAAILWALTSPIYDSLLATILSPGTPAGEKVELYIYLDKIGGGLLLAFAAYAAIWAIEAGLEARRDLDSFV